MSTLGRFFNLIRGVVIIIACIFMMMFPEGGGFIVVSIVLLMLLFFGITSLIYFFSMARHMVGGRRVLFQSIIMLSLFLYALSALEITTSYTITFMKVYLFVLGIIGVIRGSQMAKNGAAHWRIKLANGILFFAVWAVSQVYARQGYVFIYIFGAIMIYNAISIIVTNLRRYAIVYIDEF